MMATERRPLSLTARVMVFVALAIGISLVLIGNLVLGAVERHFAEQDADELVHHAQSHDQCVMPADARPPASAPSCTMQSFVVAHEADRAGGDAQGPYEPPRG